MYWLPFKIWNSFQNGVGGNTLSKSYLAKMYYNTNRFIVGIEFGHQSTYYVTVIVSNMVGLSAQAISDAVAVDHTPPVVSACWLMYQIAFQNPYMVVTLTM